MAGGRRPGWVRSTSARLLLLACLACFCLELRLIYLHSVRTAAASQTTKPSLTDQAFCPPLDETHDDTPLTPSSQNTPNLPEQAVNYSDHMPTFVDLQMAARAASHPPSVTIVLEFRTTSLLCQQLRALLQGTVQPEQVFVDASHASDGGDEAQSVVDLLDAGAMVSVFRAISSSSTDRGVDIWSRGSRRRRFQLALQASTRHVLVMDSDLIPGPKYLEYLAAAADIPECRGAIGIAGWRSLRSSNLAATESGSTTHSGNSVLATESTAGGNYGWGGVDDPPDADAAIDAMGEVSFSFPDATASLRVHRFAPADALRGAWFIRTEWVPLVFRDNDKDDELHDEVTIASNFRRYGGLSSLVLPQPEDEAGSSRDVIRKMPSEPTDSQVRAWRDQLWRAARRGERSAPWRPRLASRLMGKGAARSDTSHGEKKNRLLLVLPSLEMASWYEALYKALISVNSLFEPVLVYAQSTGCSITDCGCEVVAARLKLSPTQKRQLCRSPSALVTVRSGRFGESYVSADGNVYSHGNVVRSNGSELASMLIEMHELLIDSQASVIIAPAGDQKLSTAAQMSAESLGVTFLRPPLDELSLLEWIAAVPPEVLARWHEPKVTIAVITHRRPWSLRRLLNSISKSHFLGDSVQLSFSLDAGADNETLQLVRSWPWPHGEARVFARVTKAGLISAVVESWTPDDDESYGILLEDDIEVSPFFYVYSKLALLSYVLPPSRSKQLLAVSLYTPRMVELTMPRHRINPYSDISLTPGGKRQPLFLQQLPCSWGSMFLPQAWMVFRDYMQRRLDGAPSVHIPNSATNGWQGSWKKFMIELAYLSGQVVIYPNFMNQTSLSTNHLEAGEHIGSKTNTKKHLPIDFTVPLMDDAGTLRLLYTGDGGEIVPAPALEMLPVLNLFSNPSSLEALSALGKEATRVYNRPGGVLGHLDRLAQGLGM